MKFSTIQHNCSSGELSPKLKGRIDLKEYQNGLLEMRNFLPYKSGGVVKRPGTRYIGEETLSNDSDKVFTCPFVFSREEVYLITISNFGTTTLYSTIYDRLGTNVYANTIPIGLVETDIDLSGFSYVQIGDIVFFAHNSSLYPPFTIQRTAQNVFSFKPYSVGVNWTGDKKQILAMPFKPINLDSNICLDPSNTVVGAITVSALDSIGKPVPFFSPTDQIFDFPAPFSDFGAYFIIDDAKDNSGVFHITAFPTYLATFSYIRVFPATDIIDWSSAHSYNTGDKLIFHKSFGTVPTGLTDGNTYYVIQKTANQIQLANSLADAVAAVPVPVPIDDQGSVDFIGYFDVELVTIANAYIDIALTSHASTPNWYENLWSSKQGWPTCVAVYGQRLVFSGSRQNPDTVCFSKIGNYFHMMSRRLLQDIVRDTTTTPEEHSGLNYYGLISEDDPFDIFLSSNQINQVRWMVGSTVLHVGTIGAEYIIKAADGGKFSYLTPSCKVQSTVGGNTGAILIDTSVIFISSDGKRLMETTYSDDNGKNTTRELTVISDQIFYREAGDTDSFKDIVMKQLAWQSCRSTLWILLSNGKLVSLVLDRSSEITAWQYHVIGGTDVEITSITSIPNTENTFDDLWLCIKRTVDGDTVCYHEKMGDDFEHTLLDNVSIDENDYPWYCDSATKVVQASSTTVTGLDHLEGETVCGIANGEYFENKEVVSGGITLDEAATEIIVGLPYTARLETMPIEAGSQIGNSQSSIMRIDKCIFKLFKSLFGKFGNGVSNLYDIEYPTITANQTFTGKVRVDLDSTGDEEQTIVVEHNKPTPFSLLAIVMRGMTQD